MRNKFENLLLSILLAMTVVLGLSFWLSVKFSFNMFSIEHWQILSKMQASQTPVDASFYISITFAIIIFLCGLLVVNLSIFPKNIQQEQPQTSALPPAPIIKKDQTETLIIPETSPATLPSRPPRLNLPKNIVQIAAQHNSQSTNSAPSQKQDLSNQYNSIIHDIFIKNGYTVKPNPTIAGFTPNLFAIGTNETLWIGGIDCDKENLYRAIEKLNNVIQETLDGVEIHIGAFIVDNLQKYNNLENIFVFRSIEELSRFISENHSEEIVSQEEQESFDAYSEYIDTIIQYIKNL